MAIPLGHESAKGFDEDPNATLSENGLGVSPVTPDKNSRLPNFLRGSSEKKTTKGNVGTS